LIILNKSNPTLTCQSFFNLTTFSELNNYSSLLNFGLKHIPQPRDTSDQSIQLAFQKVSKTVPYGNTTLDILRTLNTIQKLALPTMTGLKTLHQSRNVQTPYIKILSKFEKELHDFCKVNPAKSSPFNRS
jgi:hypothetical protein